MMIRNFLPPFAAAIALAAVTIPFDAHSQGPDGPGASRTFQLIDTNGDGKVTLDEIRAEQGRLIGAADVDGDGKLSVDEFRRRGWWFQRLHTSTLFDLMDVNGDAVLTADEISAPSARWFKRYDKNADGGLTSSEAPQFQQRRGSRKHK
ncbi:MAG: EF-hand domain-containing protein [Alphaproteobacteria bacterium]